AMRRLGIEPAAVRGSGPSGRIVEADVLRLEATTRASPAGSNSGPAVSPMRLAVARKVSESFATVPHFYLRAEVDVTALGNLRKELAGQVEAACGSRLSLTDLLLRALALALRDMPQANRIWQHDTIVDLPSVDVGLVVQVDDGLMVPILHAADRLELVELARRRAEIVAAARAGALPAQAFEGGAAALSNLGRHRVDEFAAIISPPHSSMLAVGRAASRPAVFEDRLCVRQTLHLTLSVDHRVMDGGPAADFLDRIVALLEAPLLLLWEAPHA
ncbi:MAG: 2-oxo acid dehydrogenase subunit E2, partial [Planctomycetota bacterium]